MKFHAIGVKILRGKSKKTGEDFEMSRIYGLVPVETFTKGDLSAVGFGYEIAELPLDPDAIEQFRDCKFPSTLDLETDVVPRFGSYETVVIGVRKPAVTKVA